MPPHTVITHLGQLATQFAWAFYALPAVAWNCGLCKCRQWKLLVGVRSAAGDFSVCELECSVGAGQTGWRSDRVVVEAGLDGVVPVEVPMMKASPGCHQLTCTCSRRV
mmetsp:Transcript_48679/g.80896  ORF Transcript_48679/g.80896 Transcript_48679/m.80896 type:complete len:108 (-) Transcript_48679:104-427(-)